MRPTFTSKGVAFRVLVKRFPAHESSFGIQDMDASLHSAEDLKEFLMSKGVLEGSATMAAPILYDAGFTSHNAFHDIAKDDLRPFLNVPLTNQILAALESTKGMLKIVNARRWFADDPTSFCAAG